VLGAVRTLRCPEPLDLGLTFGPMSRGRHDPSSRVNGCDWIRSMHAPTGPVTIRLHVDRSLAEVTMHAWGPGRQWAVEHAIDIAGLDDRAADFVPVHPLVAALHRRFSGLRIVRLGTVYDVVLATAVEQRVTTIEARRSWHGLLRRFGTPAPGDFDLVLPPAPDALIALADGEWRRLGVEGRRSATLRAIARDASALDRAAAAGAGVLEPRLLALPGVGPWTTAHVMHVVAADADAVPVGDWHLPRHVGHALAGDSRADDARMLELLEPFRPHRARVWRLLVRGTHGPPRRAPRAPIHDLMRAEAARARR
jgi:3-methyladenine DNA glycosylase/8-oxoguanine DNA glycosylase